MMRGRGKNIAFFVVIGVLTLTALLLILNGGEALAPFDPLMPHSQTPDETDIEVPDWIEVDYIAVNGLGRDGETLKDISGIVIHYVANPGTTARQNRSYFNQPDTRASAHYIVGLDGEILQCVPLDERSAASNSRNDDTVSIELCHPDKTGEFTAETYAALVKLTAWLCVEYSLDPQEDVIRHYDITGKLCPLYFVEYEEAWEQFLRDCRDKM